MSKGQPMAFEDLERMIAAARDSVREAKAGRAEAAVAHAKVALGLLELWAACERYGPIPEGKSR